ncbi:MAG: sensor histidine kinase [Opitutales bacterium]
MWIFVSLILALILCLVLIRLLRVKRVVRDLVRAAESKKPYLITGSSPFPEAVGLRRLHVVFNDLLKEHIKVSAQEQGYLRQIETTLGNITEVVLILNERNQLLVANPAARDLLGLKAPLDGRRLESFLHSSGFLDFLSRIKQGHTVERREIEILHGKETLTLEVSGAPVPAVGEQKEALFLFVLHDITRLKRLENVRKEFVANVSHELRTPVTVIKGFTDTLLDDHAELPLEERERFLQKIQKNVDRLHALLEDLLTLSRLESTKETLVREPASLEKIIRDIAENFQLRLAPKGQRLQYDLRSGADRVPVDVIKISQVFQNLLDNVIRYAKGFTCINIRTRREDDFVRVIVEDDGCGIPEEDRRHIFERFYRVDKGRSRESGGTGLGLSIVKHIVQLHGGDVVAKESDAGGLAIQFTLPLESIETEESGEDLSTAAAIPVEALAPESDSKDSKAPTVSAPQ